MSGGAQGLAGAGGARDTGGVHFLQQPRFCQRQQAELYRGCKTSGVCHIMGGPDLILVQLGQTINKGTAPVLSLLSFLQQPEVLREVDDPDLFRNIVFSKKFFCFAMTHAEIQHIDIMTQVSAKFQVRFTDQVAMHRVHGLAGAAAAMYERDLCMGVEEEQSDKLSSGIACAADNANFQFHVLW